MNPIFYDFLMATRVQILVEDSKFFNAANYVIEPTKRGGDDHRFTARIVR